MTPPQDTRKARPRSERTVSQQAAFLARLRDKGLGLAPHVEGGRVVRPKPKNKQPASGAAGRAVTAPDVPSGTIPRPTKNRRLESLTAGSMFELIVPAPCTFLNSNNRPNRWEKARQVKAWRRAGHDAAVAAGTPRGLTRMQIDAYVVKPRANRFDPSNWQDTAKAVTDGLIDYGLAADDSRKILDGPFMRDGGKGPNALRLVITVLAS